MTMTDSDIIEEMTIEKLTNDLDRQCILINNSYYY